MAKVTFRFEEGEPVVTYATEGQRRLEVAQKSNVPIDAPCSGNAACGKCRVRLVSGELDSKITRHISEEEYQNGWRLACVSTVKGDVEVEVPDIASAYRSLSLIHISTQLLWKPATSRLKLQTSISRLHSHLHLRAKSSAAVICRLSLTVPV